MLSCPAPLAASDDPMDLDPPHPDAQGFDQQQDGAAASDDELSAEVDSGPETGTDVDDADLANQHDLDSDPAADDSDTSISDPSDDGVGGGTSPESSATEEEDAAAAAPVPVAQPPNVGGPPARALPRRPGGMRVTGLKARRTRSLMLYPGSRHTVLAAVYPLVQAKLKGNMQTKAFGIIMRVFSCLLPDGNNLPTSWYKCLSILGVKDLADYLIDSCPCDKHSYDPLLPKSEDDHCPNCLAKRFHPRVDNVGPLVPVQVRS